MLLASTGERGRCVSHCINRYSHSLCMPNVKTEKRKTPYQRNPSMLPYEKPESMLPTENPQVCYCTTTPPQVCYRTTQRKNENPEPQVCYRTNEKPENPQVCYRTNVKTKTPPKKNENKNPKTKSTPHTPQECLCQEHQERLLSTATVFHLRPPPSHSAPAPAPPCRTTVSAPCTEIMPAIFTTSACPRIVEPVCSTCLVFLTTNRC